jgi:RNA polymerase sigma-70 factor, ECF subfamily
MPPRPAGVTITRDELAERELPELMAGYQRGDPAAVEELIRRLSPGLLRFLSSPRLSRSDTEDLFQECWMRIHRSRQTYRPSEPVLPWVFAIARHTRLDGYRRRRRRESQELLVATPPENIAHAPAAPALEREEFTRLLDNLPESQREVIFMLKVSGMSLEEVAKATSSTVGAIKQKAHRAYERLRLILDRERNTQ